MWLAVMPSPLPSPAKPLLPLRQGELVKGRGDVGSPHHRRELGTGRPRWQCMCVPLTFAVGVGRTEVHGELMRHLQRKGADELGSLPQEAKLQGGPLSPATEVESELQTQMLGTSYP